MYTHTEYPHSYNYLMKSGEWIRVFKSHIEVQYFSTKMLKLKDLITFFGMIKLLKKNWSIYVYNELYIMVIRN